MKSRARLCLLPVAALAAAGCGGGEAVTGGNPSRENLTAPQAAAPPGPPSPAIPVALHGVWALEPADCTAGGEAAKRLLTVTSGELRQFGRREWLSGNIIQSSASSIDAEFSFETAEGLSKDQQGLRLWGDKLVLRNGSQAETTLYFPCRRG